MRVLLFVLEEISLWGHVRTFISYLFSRRFFLIYFFPSFSHSPLTHTHTYAHEKKRMVPNWIHLKRGHEIVESEKNIARISSSIVNVYFSLAIITKNRIRYILHVNNHLRRKVSTSTESTKRKDTQITIEKGKKWRWRFFSYIKCFILVFRFFITLGCYGSQTIFIGNNMYCAKCHQIEQHWK